jgi:hypothetical protein
MQGALQNAADEGEAKAEGEAAEPPKKGYEELLGQLDLRLTYLWRVHGVDYYAGRELSEPAEYEARLGGQRAVRGARPEEGEQPDEAEGARARLITLIGLTLQATHLCGCPMGCPLPPVMACFRISCARFSSYVDLLC